MEMLTKTEGSMERIHLRRQLFSLPLLSFVHDDSVLGLCNAPNVLFSSESLIPVNHLDVWLYWFLNPLEIQSYLKYASWCKETYQLKVFLVRDTPHETQRSLTRSEEKTLTRTRVTRL